MIPVEAMRPYDPADRDEAAAGIRPDFLLVADASAEIGLGHVMRMSALAMQLQRGGKSVVLATRTRDYIGERVVVPCGVMEFEELENLRVECGTIILDVLDAGGFSREAAPAVRSVFFDDFGAASDPSYDCDVVVNPNFGAHAISYPEAIAFRGPAWAPLRPWPEFERNYRETDNSINEVPRILYRPGHGVITPEIEKQIGCKLVPLDRFNDVNKLIKGCDAAVVSASVTALECMALGVPVLVYPQSERHQPILDAMVARGAAMPYSPGNLEQMLDDENGGGDMAKRARTYIDGRGAERLAFALIGLCK